MNLTKILNNLLDQKLHAGPFDTFKDYFNSTYENDHDENLAKMMEDACKKADPKFKPLTPEEKALRKAQQERARDLVPRVTYNMLSSSKDLPDGKSRGYYALFYGLKNTPEDKARKEKIDRVFNEGSAEERHGLFLSVMNELASFDLDEYRSMSTDQKLDRLPNIMTKLYRAMESETLIEDFKKFNCGITPEEEARFTTLYKTLHAYAGDLFAELDTILHPYYADLDLQQLNIDSATNDAIEEEMLNQGYVSGHNSIDEYKAHSGSKILTEAMKVKGEVFNEFRRNGVELDFGNILRSTPDGTPIFDIGDNYQYEKALKNGETLYFVNNKNDSGKELLAVHDVYGKGYPTVISPERALELEELQGRKPIRMEPVPKPNALIRFFDSINRLFNGKGLESVNNYNRYLQDCESFDRRMNQYQAEYRQKLEQIKPETVERGYTDSFNKAAEETKAQKKRLEQGVKGRAVASSYMLRGKLTPEQTKWAKENPDAFRDGFSLLKEDILASSKGKPTEEEKEYIAEIEAKAQSSVNILESRENPLLTNTSATAQINEEKPEISSPRKTASGAVSLP